MSYEKSINMAESPTYASQWTIDQVKKTTGPEFKAARDFIEAGAILPYDNINTKYTAFYDDFDLNRNVHAYLMEDPSV